MVLSILPYKILILQACSVPSNLLIVVFVIFRIHAMKDN